MNATHDNNKTLLNFMRLMGNTERLKIAGMLGVNSLSAAQLAEQMHLPLETVQAHLEQLLGAGLIRSNGEEYSLESKTLTYLSRQVLAQSQPHNRAEDFEGDDYERKVLSDYFAPDGSLKSVPTQQKKLLVILRYIVKVFEPGQHYPEKQVNEMLRKYHGDTATLRRNLVDSRLMERSRGEYWRV